MTFHGIDIDVQRKPIRTLRLAVYPPDGRVRLSVPLRTADARIEAFLTERLAWIEAARRRMQQAPAPETIPEGERLAAWRSLRARLDVLLPRCAERMGTTYSGYSVRLMKSRWGSCNVRTRHLCFNLLLASKDDDCLEYVVVHELTHTFERLHNARFHALMDRFLPDWRERKRRLNGR